jgi:N6-adenosine-specific RNA methylase IME4
MKKHRFNIFPEMMVEDYSRLKADLHQNGFDPKQPIYTYEGEILDGWNRFRVCTELNIIPVFREFAGNDNDAIMFVMRTNKRRNLTSSQWAAIAVEAEEMVESIREAVEKERREKQAETQSITMKKEPMCQLIDRQVNQPERTTQKLATTFNTNRTYISEAQKLKETKPLIFEQVKSGEKTLTEVKKDEKIQQRKEYIQEQKQAIENGSIELPKGVFEVVAIDPPWNYGREYDPDSSRVANPYPEMSQSELLELKPPFADDCVVFLWTTHAFLFDAKELMNKWGFTYKANLVWDKEHIGMGAWFRMQCEFCLVGIKGKPIWNNTKWRDIIREPRREHSRKPEIFYEMVNEITVGRKLDYFSRGKRNGWEVFGNDTAKF